MNPYMNGESTSDETASVPKPVLEKTDVDTLLKNIENELPTYSGNPNRSPIVDFTTQPHISEEKLDYIVETLEQLQNHAKEKGYDFDKYMANMRSAGMTEVKQATKD